MLQILLSAYKRFDKTVVSTTNKISKQQQVQNLFDTQIGYLNISKIKDMLPNISEITINRAIRQLLKNNYITKKGSTKNSQYIKKNN
jgi:Fic family protein